MLYLQLIPSPTSLTKKWLKGQVSCLYCRFMICRVHHVQSTVCVLSLSLQKSFIRGKEYRLFLCHKWENVPATRWWRALRGHNANMLMSTTKLASKTPVSLAAFPGIAVRSEDRLAKRWKAGKGIRLLRSMSCACGHIRSQIHDILRRNPEKPAHQCMCCKQGCASLLQHRIKNVNLDPRSS